MPDTPPDGIRPLWPTLDAKLAALGITREQYEAGWADALPLQHASNVPTDRPVKNPHRRTTKP